MNKRVVPVLLFTLATALSTGYSADKNAAPGWVSNLEGTYPKASFLTAEGTGDTVKSAQADSASALAQLFSVSVQVDTVDIQKYSDLTKGSATQSTSEDTYTKTVGLKAGEQFMNLRFSDPYTDGSGVVHVLAYLERRPTGTLYRNRISKDWDTVDQFILRVNQAGTVLAKFALYDAAYEVAKDAQRMASQLPMIDPQGFKPEDKTADFQSLAQKRDEAATKLTYKVEIQGDSDGKVAGIVQKTLGKLGFSANPAGLLSLKGTFSAEPEKVSTDFKSVHWSLNITLSDESGSSVATVVKESRENGKTDAAATAFVYRELDKQIGLLLTKAVQDNLTHMALKS